MGQQLSTVVFDADKTAETIEKSHKRFPLILRILKYQRNRLIFLSIYQKCSKMEMKRDILRPFH